MKKKGNEQDPWNALGLECSDVLMTVLNTARKELEQQLQHIARQYPETQFVQGIVIGDTAVDQREQLQNSDRQKIGATRGEHPLAQPFLLQGKQEAQKQCGPYRTQKPNHVLDHLLLVFVDRTNERK